MHADTTSANRATLERWIGMVTAGDLTDVASVWSPDLVLHTGSGEIRGYEEIDAAFAQFATAFPLAQLEVVHLFEEGDRLAGFYHVTATHSGAFLGIEPTGKRVGFNSSAAYRFADGLIAEAWGMDDVIAILDQLGVLPLAAAAS
jgi:predicted ester cyclase